MISCSFSSLTRKVAFGSSSVTTPGNSKASSFAIRYLEVCHSAAARTKSEPKFARNLADDAPFHNWSRRSAIDSFIARSGPRKALADAREQLVAHLAVGIEPLLAAPFDIARIRRRPILDIDAAGAGEFQRPVMGLRRQRDDEIEIESLPLVDLLEGDRLVP